MRSNIRNRSEIQCCTIPTHMSGLEVQVTDLEISMLKVLVKAFRGKARFRQATLSCDSSYCFVFFCLFVLFSFV